MKQGHSPSCLCSLKKGNTCFPHRLSHQKIEERSSYIKDLELYSTTRTIQNNIPGLWIPKTHNNSFKGDLRADVSQSVRRVLSPSTTKLYGIRGSLVCLHLLEEI